MPQKTIIALNYKHLTYATKADNSTWTTGTAEIGYRTVALAVDPNPPLTIYVGTDGEGILKTQDFGTNWEPVGLAGQIVRSLAVNLLQPGTIYAGTKPAHLYVSRNYGATWDELSAFRQLKRWWWITPAEQPMSAYVMDIAVSPTNPDVIIVGVEAAGVYRSDDGGQTWEGHMKGAVRDCHMVAFHPTNGNWVYAGGGEGAAYSQDGGKTWLQPDPFNLWDMTKRLLLKQHPEGTLDRRYGWAVAGDLVQPNIWFFSASTSPSKAHSEGDAQAYIYRCKDGQNWERLSGGLPQPLDDFPYYLHTDADKPGHLYAMLQNGDIWHSDNSGDTWAQMPLNIESYWYRAIII